MDWQVGVCGLIEALSQNLLILLRSINMQLYLFSFLFLHYMFRVDAALLRLFCGVGDNLKFGACRGTMEGY
jgi:hypothetical protein